MCGAKWCQIRQACSRTLMSGQNGHRLFGGLPQVECSQGWVDAQLGVVTQRIRTSVRDTERFHREFERIMRLPPSVLRSADTDGPF